MIASSDINDSVDGNQKIITKLHDPKGKSKR
jgi:hypothetical protein